MFRDLETQRLLLKNIGYDDAEFLYREFSSEAVNTYLYDAEPISSPDEAKEWIAFYTQAEPRDQHRWIIVLKDTGDKAGTCGFHCWWKSDASVEIGYDLLPEYWQRGYASEALREIIHFAEHDMQVKTIVAKIAEKNIPSINTATKLGFHRTESIVYEEFHGVKYPHYVYRLKL